MVGGNKEHRSLRTSHMKNLDWRTILLSIVITAFGLTAWQYLASHTNQANLKRELESKAHQINDQLDKLEGQQKKTNEQKKEIEKLKKQNKELQAKKAEQARLASRSSAVAYAEAPQAVSGCGDNKYASYIYMKESGCRTTAVNSIGCRGIGQACPGSKLPCGDDYACQNKWFTNYALSRYGSWEAAYQFHLQHNWW